MNKNHNLKAKSKSSTDIEIVIPCKNEASMLLATIIVSTIAITVKRRKGYEFSE